jgi:O-antigen/teichoic acid export membrane protein
VAEAFLECDLAATVTKHAHTVTVLAAIAALAMATCVGYYFGRRERPTRQSWKKRTSRIAVGRLAFTLLVSLTARRIRLSAARMWA